MMDVLVRTTGDPAAMGTVIQQELQNIDRSVAKFKIATVTSQMNNDMGERRFDTFLLGAFAVAAHGTQTQ